MAEAEQSVTLNREILVSVLRELLGFVREMERFYEEAADPWGEG